MDKSDFIPCLFAWALVTAVLVWRAWSRPGAGLVLSYCFQLSMLYWLGGLFHSLPWSELPETATVLAGLQKSTNGMVAFALGAFAMGPWLAGRIAARKEQPVTPDPALPRMFIWIGVAFYFVVAPTLGRVAGFNAIGAVGSELVVVGISLNCWRAWSRGGAKNLVVALAPALLIPIVTLVVQGFLSFGVIALSTVILFSAQFFRPRWALLAAGVAFGYLGLTGYGAYMRDRNQNREVVWGGESLGNRVAAFQKTLATADWFDWRDPEHLAFVDDRLNQNFLVGSSVTYLSNTGNYAYGSTLMEAVVNMIPRVIWPSKPTSAGSFGLATRFTGIEFAMGTSVGIGPVMELYGNFGDLGIWVGFIVLGALIQAMDTMAGYHLSNGTWLDFANWYLVGISFLNVSGSFVECTASA
ncbi:MAG: hypothetical protein M3N54_11350, partial [Acidobacteriota bacterium]|nr:hypothetical protein [Acidobacteriota bacterium]